MKIAPTLKIVNVRQGYSADFHLSEDGDWLCSHADAYIDPACCNGSPDECGRDTCGCGGQDSVVCPAVDCTGLEDYEAEDIMERLQTGGDYDD